MATALVVAGVGCDSSMMPTAPASQASCLARAQFGQPASSPWVLPYQVGETWTVTQSYCNPNGGHRDTFAYDFALTMGSPITAARNGEVIATNDQYPDSDHVEGHENNVWVLHADGTVVRYTHLMQGSVTVEVGDQVFRGDELGANGASGNTGGFPHLHFEVFASRGNYSKSNAVPVNFANAGGPLDSRGGLQAGTAYTALSY